MKELYKRSTTGKKSAWRIEVEGNKFRTISGFTDGKKVTSEWTVCESKSYCTAEEQALNQATALHTKKKDLGAFENIDDIDTPVFFKPMLAHDFTKLKDKITEEVNELVDPDTWVKNNPQGDRSFDEWETDYKKDWDDKYFSLMDKEYGSEIDALAQKKYESRMLDKYGLIPELDEQGYFAPNQLPYDENFEFGLPGFNERKRN